jgi:hypothetical protein
MASFFPSLEPYHWLKFIAGGIIIAAAFFTKQVALLIFLVFATISLMVIKGKNWLQGLTACAVEIFIFGALEKTTEGRFLFYFVRSVLLYPIGSAWWDFWKSLLSKMWP